MEAVLKIPDRDVSPADEGINRFPILSHTFSTDMGFREDCSMSMFFSSGIFLAMRISASQFFFCAFFRPY
jgi:hypothetical protein